MPKLLQYDYQYMSAAKVASFGFKQEELAKLGRKLSIINQHLLAQAEDGDLSFRQLPYDSQSADLIIKLIKKIPAQFTTLVVVGIGGSNLGARAICEALGPKNNKKVYFTGDTPDPQILKNLLKQIDLSKTIFYVVSKSGDTLEPLVAFLFLRQQVIKKVGQLNHKQHFIITTNLQSGKLLQIAQKEGYPVLAHYEGGGRFSVLSVNGLLPAAWLGLDIKQMLAGAKDQDVAVKTNSWLKNLPFIFAALHYLGYKKGRQTINVLMPYSEALNAFSFWYRQLWAESLGKKNNRQGRVVEIDLTPIAAAGPQDQHSQLQLYNEGANNKIFTFIRLQDFGVNYRVPLYKNSGLEFLADKGLAEILNIEQQAVAWSLMKNKRANATLILPNLNEYYLGQLFQFYELAVVYLGELLGINVFDQPGVEDSKKQMRRMLLK